MAGRESPLNAEAGIARSDSRMDRRG
jgi:hypothetical protein